MKHAYLFAGSTSALVPMLIYPSALWPVLGLITLFIAVFEFDEAWQAYKLPDVPPPKSGILSYLAGALATVGISKILITIEVCK